MTPPHGSPDPDERALTRTLRGRADSIHTAPLRPGDVIQHAIGIRRRRRVTALAVAAVVAVIAVPTALGASGVLQRDASPQPAEPPEQTSLTEIQDALGLDGVASSSSLGSVAPVATGVVVGKDSGEPVPDAVVTLHAWARTAIQEKYPDRDPRILVGWAVADEDGRFEVRIDPAIDMSTRIDSNGSVEFDLTAYGERRGAYQPWSFSAIALTEETDPESETEAAVLDPDTREVLKPFDIRLELPERAYGSAGASPLDVADLPTGAPPKIAYAAAGSTDGRPPSWTLHTPTGDIPLPGNELFRVAASGEDWVVTTADDETWRTTVLEAPTYPSGDTWTVTGRTASSPDGGTVAWVTTDREVMVRTADGETSRLGTIDRKEHYAPVVVAGEDCDEGCSVFLNRDDGVEQIVMDDDGAVADPPDGLLKVTTSGRGQVGGYVEIRDDGTCSELRDAGSLVFETCDWSLDEVSPDGEHLIGLPGYLDGLGPTYLALLDVATGKPAVEWRGTAVSATYFDQAWEDDEHVLLVTWQDGEWSIVRAGLDGSLEYAVPPVEGDEYSTPYRLAR